jgi:hypothetical protein
MDLFRCLFLLEKTHKRKACGLRPPPEKRKERNIMDFVCFTDKVKNGILTRLEDVVSVHVQEVNKNNGIKLHGLSIVKKEQSVSPTIYLEVFFRLYEEGMSLSKIVSIILEMYDKGTPKDNMSMNFFKDFEQVKSKISYKIVNTKKNEDLLEQIPHIRFLDLSICFFYPYFHKNLGNGSILIYNNHVDLWHTDKRELYALARENTPNIFIPEFKSMKEVIESYAPDTHLDLKEMASDIPMYVLSNQKHCFGATCMIYPQVLQNISKNFDRNFIVLPSSIHEVILLPASSGGNRRELRAIVHDVNQTALAPDEILSESIYYYDNRSAKLKNI